MSAWQPYLPYNALLCRYNEIATKGRNRRLFEEHLAEGLQRALGGVGQLDFRFPHGRIFALPKAPKSVFTPADLDLLRQKAHLVPGLVSVSPGFLLNPDMEEIEDAVLQHFPTVYAAFRACSPPLALTYAMRARRSDKSFPLTSEQIERHFAELLLPERPELRLDLRHANLVMELEVRSRQAFLSFERIAGAGGLPPGTGGRVLALLSGGFDSPVACHQMMRRGCMVDFITFHSSPYTPPAYLTKVCTLVRKLNECQRRGRLVAVNLLPAQLAIRDHCRSRHRTVLYRRFMVRIAALVAKDFNAMALVTGDNLGQVASQTLPNMAAINDAAPIMVLRPLLTYDKLDTLAIAERIGTYAISVEPIPDSCTVFAPDDPATAVELKAILDDEASLDIPSLLKACLSGACIINVDSMRQHDYLKIHPHADDLPETPASQNDHVQPTTGEHDEMA